jgi:hypothetical protein
LNGENKMNEKATREYYQTIIEIDKEIETLKDKIAKHNQQSERIHWGHVGDMKYILSQLEQLNNNE